VRKASGPKGKKANKRLGIFHNEELKNVYSSQSIVRLIITKRMMSARQYKIWSENSNSIPIWRKSVDGEIIIKLDISTMSVRMWSVFIWLRYWSGGKLS
jgi:hypothetical protein